LKRGPTDLTLKHREEERKDLNVEVVNLLVALIAGILILIMPRLLSYVVAIYLIAVGIIGTITISIFSQNQLRSKAGLYSLL
jgi:Protein of unknown function (DUF3096)